MVYKVKETPKEQSLAALTTDAIYKKADEIRRAWMATLDTDDKIKAKVVGLLEGSFRHIVLLYMGMRTDGYNRFEIDNCNNRASSMRSNIERLVEPTVRELIERHKPEILVDGLTQAHVDALRKQYQSEIYRALSQAVYKRSQSDAEVILDEILDEILEEDRTRAKELIDNKIGGDELAKGEVHGTR